MDNKKRVVNFSNIYDIKISDILKHKDKYKKYLEEETEKARVEDFETAKNARNFWIL